MLNFILALVLGVFFGFSLNKAGLTKYSKIVNVYRFTDMTVLKFMMTALVVSMSGLYTLRGLGLITFPNVPATYIVGNLVGGVIFGFGMALSGYCPGTAAAGAGEGGLPAHGDRRLRTGRPLDHHLNRLRPVAPLAQSHNALYRGAGN